MKQAMISKESLKIFDSMKDRLNELSVKLIKGNFNQATSLAYEIGFISDIDDTLKKLKIKRTMVRQKNVKEIEVKDIEESAKIIEKAERKGRKK